MDKKSNHCSNLISHGGVSLNSALKRRKYVRWIIIWNNR